MKQSKNYKQWIPNILTASRIIMTPIIITLGILKNIPIVIILTTIAALTDFIDGKLARKWNVVSEFGAKLDAVADKVFAIGLCISLTSILPIVWILVILESILAICNLIFHYKSHKTQTLWIGKVKTTGLFITILFVICLHFLSPLEMIVQGLVYLCINLQVLCLLEYSINFYDNMHPITVEDNPIHQQIMEDTVEQDTIVLENLDDLIEKYELQENNIE